MNIHRIEKRSGLVKL